MSSRSEREAEAYDSAEVHRRSARLQRRFHHVFSCPDSRALENCFDARIEAWTPGARVLDYGCYDGELSGRLLALEPGRLTGIDISPVAIERARERFGDRADFRVMDAHRLEFPDAAFDLVVGRAILHHLDWETAVAEIHRVLAPGGHALFVEPLAGNPVGAVLRALTPRARTTDEQPLSRSQLSLADRTFDNAEHHFANLVSVPAAMLTSLFPVGPDNHLLRLTHRVDRRLAQTPLRHWMRIAALTWRR